jgi:hypothetical protein
MMKSQNIAGLIQPGAWGRRGDIDEIAWFFPSLREDREGAQEGRLERAVGEGSQRVRAGGTYGFIDQWTGGRLAPSSFCCCCCCSLLVTPPSRSSDAAVPLLPRHLVLAVLYDRIRFFKTSRFLFTFLLLAQFWDRLFVLFVLLSAFFVLPH